MYVWMYVCMYTMYVCMHMYMYLYIYILVGTWVMGLVAHIMMYDRICHAVIEIWLQMC